MWLLNPYRFGTVYDTDAAAYIAAVEAADGQTLETGVKDAINAFVIGCKSDGTWTAIKASCIMAGARTLAGALVPLVGAAPTRFGTEGGWNYNRKTGLQGNGTDNYLNSNYAMPNTLASNNHLAVEVNTTPTTAGSLADAVVVSPNVFGLGIYRDSTNSLVYYSSWTTTNYLGPSLANSTLAGTSRSSSGSFTARSNNTSSTITQSVPANPPSSLTPYIFCRNSAGSPALYTNARLAFYSIGESLNLALLDARVTTLINAISAAIP